VTFLKKMAILNPIALLCAVATVLAGGVLASSVTWGSCSAAGPSAGNARDCSFITTPLNPADPTGQNITFFIRRYYEASPTSKALFLLQGGPGDSTLTFDGTLSG
jgi:hypothetical protein